MIFAGADVVCPHCKSTKIVITSTNTGQTLSCQECGKMFPLGDKKVTKKEQIRMYIEQGLSLQEILDKMSPKTRRQRRYIKDVYMALRAGNGQDTSSKALSEEPIRQAAEALITDFKLLYQQLAIIKNACNQMMDIVSRMMVKNK